jgi:DNA-binding SARP family transcriptional activator
MAPRFGILGSLEVSDGDVRLDLAPGRQRALLALLVLHANEPVSADRLIEALWAGVPPASAQKVLQGYVSQLRRVLPADTIATRGSGYELRADNTDAREFEGLVEQARAEDPAAAARSLRRALGLWRGRALADFEYEDWALGEADRLEELRLVALEDRLEADLGLGGGPALVPELERLMAEHPLRERLRGQLMLALYRSGRQAEALEAYRDGRRLLDEKLGLTPSPFLEELERRILRHDPDVAPQRGFAVPAAIARRGRTFALAGVLLLAAAGAAAG